MSFCPCPIVEPQPAPLPSLDAAVDSFPTLAKGGPGGWSRRNLIHGQRRAGGWSRPDLSLWAVGRLGAGPGRTYWSVKKKGESRGSSASDTEPSPSSEREGEALAKCNQLIQPAIGHHDIIIQQHQVFPASKLQPLIDRGRKTQVCGIGNHGDRHGRQVPRPPGKGPSIVRPVVDDDQLPRRPGVDLERGDALLGKLKLVPALCGEVRYVAFSL